MRGLWPKVSLGELLRLERRRAEVRADGQYREIGIYCFGRGIFHKPPRSGLEVGDKALFLMKEADFILQVTFAWEGAVAIVSAAEEGMYGSIRYPTFRVDETRCVPGFLLNYFRTHEGLQQLIKICPGSAGRNRVLSIKRIPVVLVPLPTLAEQRRVMARIEELSAQIHEARTFRNQAAEEAEAFVTSVHASLSGKRTKVLGEILKLDEDSEPIEASGCYPQVGVKSFGGGLFPKGAIEGTGTTYRAFNRLYEGALLLSQVKGWEGAVSVCPAELAGWFVSPEYRTFRCIPSEARPKYLAPLVRTEWFWSKLANATRGVGARRERTRPEQFLNIELPMPDIEQQKRGEALFAEVDALKHLQAETAAELDAFLPAILDQAFKGEL